MVTWRHGHGDIKQKTENESPEAEFLVEHRELKPVYFPVSSCFLPGICSPAMRGIFGRLPLPGFSSLSRFLPVLKLGLGSRFRLVW
jgi:hypothetical protein